MKSSAFPNPFVLLPLLSLGRDLYLSWPKKEKRPFFTRLFTPLMFISQERAEQEEHYCPE